MIRWLILWLTLCVSCLAAPTQIEQQAALIRAVLQEADEAYYNGNEAIMADVTYDALRDEYVQLRQQHPELPDYAGIGAPAPDTADEVKHTRPMLSLKKAYSDDAVEAFVNACGLEESYCVEPKLDGVSIVLRYRKGLLVQALSRGDGQTGMDVTKQIRASGCVPLMLTNAPAMLEVRGEVIIPFQAFNALNTRRREAGQDPLKSPRNTTAGTLRMKDLSKVAQRGLACRVFEIVATDPMPATHTEGLDLAQACGLPVVESRVVSGATVLKAIDTLNRKRSDLPYASDGVVIRLNDRAAYERMGTTQRWPNGALARKYRPEPVETRLLEMTWVQGDNGRLIPVARFEPVEVEGAVIQRASLHSLQHLRALDLMIGDRIQVIRAGGAVPAILGRAPGPRTGEEQKIPDPK